MKITRVFIWHVALTSLEPYYMADGKDCETVESVVIRVDTDSKFSGWGEVCPIPHYLEAYARGVAPAIKEMAPVLLGADPIGAESLMSKLNAYLIGHRYAKSAIDTALWDITGKVANLPLYSLLGGRRHQSMPVFHSITCIAPDEMAKIAVDTHQQGVRQFQVKLGADKDWQADVERLIKVREVIKDGSMVFGDWNCGSSQLDAVRVGRAVAHLDIMLEQPCPTVEECAAVRSATGLPMKLDENAHDTASLLKAHSLGCMEAAAIKLSKFGGISAARRGRDLCTYFGTKLGIEDTWGSDITTAAVLHLGCTTSPAVLQNVCDLSVYVSPHIASDGSKRVNGCIAPPEGPGLGVTPDLDLLKEPDLIID